MGANLVDLSVEAHLVSFKGATKRAQTFKLSAGSVSCQPLPEVDS
jgi:hypothetical protein